MEIALKIDRFDSVRFEVTIPDELYPVLLPCLDQQLLPVNLISQSNRLAAFYLLSPPEYFPPGSVMASWRC